MTRICKFKLDNIELAFGTMTTLEAETYIEESNVLRRKQDWEGLEEHSRRVSAMALNKADQSANWTDERIKAEFDGELSGALFNEIRKRSGLRIIEPGEAPAVSASPRSEAASLPSSVGLSMTLTTATSDAL